MKLACLGDSNTWGYDGRSYWGERFPREVRWTGRLAALPGVAECTYTELRDTVDAAGTP